MAGAAGATAGAADAMAMAAVEAEAPKAVAAVMAEHFAAVNPQSRAAKPRDLPAHAHFGWDGS